MNLAKNVLICWFALAGIGNALALLACSSRSFFSPPNNCRERKKSPKGPNQQLLLFFVILLVLAPSVTAQGIGVSPNKVEVEAFKGETIEKQLTIFNPSDEKLDFVIRAEEWFSFFPETFSLNPYGEQKVILKIKPEKVGNFDKEINVMLKPKNSEGLAINLGTTVKVKIKSITRINHLIGTGIIFSIVVFGLGMVLLVKRHVP